MFPIINIVIIIATIIVDFVIVIINHHQYFCLPYDKKIDYKLSTRCPTQNSYLASALTRFDVQGVYTKYDT